MTPRFGVLLVLLSLSAGIGFVLAADQSEFHDAGRAGSWRRRYGVAGESTPAIHAHAHSGLRKPDRVALAMARCNRELTSIQNPRH